MSEGANELKALIERWNRDYVALHVAKEDAFWTAYMGLADDATAARAELDRREIALKSWLQDPTQLEKAKGWSARLSGDGGDAGLAAALTPEERLALEGWERTFSANAIPSAEARALAEEIVHDEGSLARARSSMNLGYEDANRRFVPASSVRLGLLVRNDPDPTLRKAAWKGLRSIETCALNSGFVELVRKRNELGRSLGGEDYYDWKAKQAEGVSKAQIFELLGDLEERTRDAAKRSVELLRERSVEDAGGESAATPWNASYAISGEVSNEFDRYFPFSKSLERWGRAFAAMGLDYRGATMALDLVDRKGKYENGFMHGPEPAWTDRGKWNPARIQFTANAIPGLAGSGRRATETFFHEGGHALHFANIDMPSPCFAQEFAPTSVAFAEVQSMFFDGMLDDADWQRRYARTEDEREVPWELIEKTIRLRQPFAAWNLRAMLVVPFAEKAIYELPDDELSAERILETIREVETRILGLEEGSPRPVLSVPHLLAGESSAYYHGYVMANMAVEQTRDYFLRRDGYLLDNPRIGPDLRDAYWKPGNRYNFFDYISRLTGDQPSAVPLANRVNRSTEEAVARARESFDREPSLPRGPEAVELNAKISVRHGRETICESHDAASFAEASRIFAAWIDSLETQNLAAKA